MHFQPHLYLTSQYVKYHAQLYKFTPGMVFFANSFQGFLGFWFEFFWGVCLFFKVSWKESVTDFYYNLQTNWINT